MAETVGERLFQIRQACGSVREPETLEDFSARVERVTGETYSPMTLSLLERMKQKWRIEDVEVFAAVDPLKRGRSWLAWGEATAEPQTKRLVTGAEAKEILENSQAEQESETDASPRRRRSQ